MMAEKNMRLSDVLEKIGNRCGQPLPPRNYFFRAQVKTTRKAQTVILSLLKASDYQANDMLHYKNMNNANVFDMNTEVKNLASFNLEVKINSRTLFS